MLTDQTIDYYNSHAGEYYARTVDADVSANLARFAKYVRPGGCIVDVGCASGRDIRYFLNAGFYAIGIDASKELCRLAREHTGAEIVCTTIQEWRPAHRYDGVWANASLLHLSWEEIHAFVSRLPDMLADEGIAYMSFKSGIPTGVDAEGRYFTDISREALLSMIGETQDLELVEDWESRDALHRDDFTWINVIVRRKHA